MVVRWGATRHIKTVEKALKKKLKKTMHTYIKQEEVGDPRSYSTIVCRVPLCPTTAIMPNLNQELE